MIEAMVTIEIADVTVLGPSSVTFGYTDGSD
jgi:hypothetical protein